MIGRRHPPVRVNQAFASVAGRVASRAQPGHGPRERKRRRDTPSATRWVPPSCRLITTLLHELERSDKGDRPRDDVLRRRPLARALSIQRLEHHRESGRWLARRAGTGQGVPAGAAMDHCWPAGIACCGVRLRWYGHPSCSARDERLQREVAVKRLHSVEPPVRWEYRFVREARSRRVLSTTRTSCRFCFMLDRR